MSEALGQDALELLIDYLEVKRASSILNRNSRGEGWSGKFPAKKKSGERFTVISTSTPFIDDDGQLTGIVIVSNDYRPFQESDATSHHVQSSAKGSSSAQSSTGPMSKGILDSQHPLQVAIASKLSNLVLLSALCFQRIVALVVI